MGKIISLYGLPACGKTTQATKLSEEFGMVQFSMGSRLRKEIASGSELGQRIEPYVKQGILVPDELMAEVIEHVSDEIKDKGMIFDGFPRMTSQAEMLDKIAKDLNLKVDAFIYLNITPEEALRRISERAEIEHREDDKDQLAVKNRVEVFRQESTALLEHYRNQNRLTEIDGELGKDGVYEEIKKCLNL